MREGYTDQAPARVGVQTVLRQPATDTLAAILARPNREKRPAVPALAPDIAFLVYHGVAVGPIYRAGERSRLLGLPALRCLIASGAISDADFTAKAALHFGVRQAHAATPDPRTDLVAALRQGWFRATLPDGQIAMVIASSGPALPVVQAGLRRTQRPFTALASAADFNAILVGHFGPAMAAAAASSVPDAQSARSRVTPGQRRFFGALAVAFAAGLALAPKLTVTLVPMLLGLLFLCAAVIHLAACWEGWRLDDPPVASDDASLPLYSVLVPLHNEGPEVIKPLVAALEGLDYPVEKLQILLIVEAGDGLTQQAIGATPLPPHFTMFIAPDGAPRTKPRALNAAMPFVTGSMLVVYDAEDRPDRLQLRQAAAVFARSPARIACLQARLAIDNPGDGWLAAFFRIEYAALFDVTKSGSARLGHPVPLGGTSNHFRTDVLRSIGLWDAWNVTEDADLGFRLARCGYGVVDLHSTTHEEAPAGLRGWMGQRTRWLKGWMQTVLSHSRDPAQVLRELGPGDFIAALSLSLGVVIGTLLAPFFAVMVVWRISIGHFLAGPGWLDAIADGLIIVLGLFGALSTYLPAIIATRRRDLSGLRRLIPLLPIYHLLMSVAGWRALYELAVAPHRWNKTRHGLSRRRRSDAAVQKQ